MDRTISGLPGIHFPMSVIACLQQSGEELQFQNAESGGDRSNRSGSDRTSNLRSSSAEVTIPRSLVSCGHRWISHPACAGIHIVAVVSDFWHRAFPQTDTSVVHLSVMVFNAN